MLHAKTAVVDSSWGSVGSFNLDNLSFYFNYEGNIVSRDETLVDELTNHFLTDIENANEIKTEEWSKRPTMNKAREWLARLISKLL